MWVAAVIQPPHLHLVGLQHATFHQLVDDGKLERLYNGVYYLSYVTILGTKGRVSIDRYIEKKYLNANGLTSGYVTGLQLANKYGFTTQNPSCYEICSNEATTKQRKQIVDGNTIIVYKPVTDITEKNKSVLQFLDLMSIIDKYSEIAGADALQQPVGRVGKPADIAETVLFLCSDKASFITGENICVDGGMTRLMIYHGEHGWAYQG